MKKLISILTPLILIFSLFCGCKNTDVKSESSIASSETNKENNTESEISVDKDYNEMMNCISKLTVDSTDEEIYEALGEPDEVIGSGICYEKYKFGNYTVTITECKGGRELSVYDEDKDESTNILYPTKPNNPYNESSNYSKKVEELVNKVKNIKPDSTKEEVIKILGEPDKTNKNLGVEYDTYYFDDYRIWITYYNGGLLVDILNDDERNINVVYPE